MEKNVNFCSGKLSSVENSVLNLADDDNVLKRIIMSHQIKKWGDINECLHYLILLLYLLPEGRIHKCDKLSFIIYLYSTTFSYSEKNMQHYFISLGFLSCHLVWEKNKRTDRREHGHGDTPNKIYF